MNNNIPFSAFRLYLLIKKKFAFRSLSPKFAYYKIVI